MKFFKMLIMLSLMASYLAQDNDGGCLYPYRLTTSKKAAQSASHTMVVNSKDSIENTTDTGVLNTITLNA
jgi:hypothetical protein